MNQKVNLSVHLQQLNFFARSLGESINDYSASQNGTPVYYNMDFAILCPLLFDRPSFGSKDFLKSSKDSTRRVLSKSKEEGHFDLVISGSTIIEFYDQLVHLLNELDLHKVKIPQKYKKENLNQLRESLITSHELQSDLLLLTKQGLDQRIRNPINKLLHLLDNNVIRGIGDIIDPSLIRKYTNVEIFNEYLEEHKTKRLAYDTARAYADSVFHYKIDTANNCLTRAASNIKDFNTLFVTPTPLNIHQCTIGKKYYARLERTPLFLLNTNRLFDKGIIDNELEFLKSAAREAVQLIDSLRKYKELEDCPIHLQLKLAHFYHDYISFLNKAPKEGEQNEFEEKVEEIINVLANRDRIQEVLDEAVQDVKDGAKLIELHKSNYDLPYINEFDFSDDPVLKNIRDELDISI